jgi:Xaa-Pro aminopeptidase/Xaa-Pro dipeptidase
VLEAERVCVEAVRPGVRCADLDALARDVLARHDLAAYFAHSLGHGVGLAIHELPMLSGSSDEVLTAGMTITIEPGVYVPGLGGVRIEDLVIVTEAGHEVLSRADKERV